MKNLLYLYQKNQPDGALNRFSKRQVSNSASGIFVGILVAIGISACSIVLYYVVRFFIYYRQSKVIQSTINVVQVTNAYGNSTETTTRIANPDRINVMENRNMITTEDLASYPLVTMKEYKKSTSIKILEKALDKNKKNNSLRLDRKSEIPTDDRVECLICIEELKDDDLVRIIPCYHLFHRRCIDTWLLEQSGSCPKCRLDLRLIPENGIKNQNQTLDTIQQSNQNRSSNVIINQNFNRNVDNHWAGSSGTNQTPDTIQQSNQNHSSNVIINQNFNRNVQNYWAGSSETNQTLNIIQQPNQNRSSNVVINQNLNSNMW
ncbi:hypothetical protein BB559_006883 [Furculomyces boomerangus]|uniref:RING-type domain-containing protein n=1 Tax=Furculomyces boomerangus TaxID=61424 RepID=A0A2T9XZD7_9FUNG|nr:hypothetical protein BB559_007051 [Furculomyces boomerangus]PVU85671.1 hypothetical protein BB559_006883 [Furculomyces boomerangus]